MLYDRVAGLPLTIDEVDLVVQERETSSDFTRATTTIELSGDGHTGRGEDVTYEQAAHHEFAAAGPPYLAGDYTIAEFSDRIAGEDLFPTEPEREDFRKYRRWGFESAALDLALRQADTNLAAALERDYDPVEFVVSTRLGEPPSMDRIDALLDAHDDLQFKLDPTTEWDEDLIAELADLGKVRILDLKARYEGTDVDQPPDTELYRRLVEAFPDAIVEDPGLNDETRAVLTDHEERVSWDGGITDVESIQLLPWDPEYLNIKPSRFGSLESLLDSIEFCLQRDVTLYGGGQFELGVGRGQIQALASICYPDSPNDVAPAGYNDPTVPEGLPTSPLDPPEETVGFGWG
jgi:hypothetical protein